MNPNTFKGRSLLTWKDYTPDEILCFLDLALKVKKQRRQGKIMQRFKGKSIALIFEKRSTRTRCSFETAIGEEGGQPVFLSTQDIQLGGKESIEDTARVLGRMFDGIEFRGFKQEYVDTLAKYAGIPVYNGLTDVYHPTQALADVMTLYENFGYLKGLTLCFCGDGRNNVVRSLMIICAKLGINLTIISPESLWPDEATKKDCAPWAAESGATFTITADMNAVKGADALYTDVWVSMGEEAKKEERIQLLTPFQISSQTMKNTGNDSSIFLHCLPAIKGQEVTAEVIESSQSRVWDEAENRKHTIKAIMLATLGIAK